MMRDALASSSAMSTQAWDASIMAAATAGCMLPPETRVAGPLALMMVGTPSSSKTLIGASQAQGGGQVKPPPVK
jgi:hypothetical protein